MTDGDGGTLSGQQFRNRGHARERLADDGGRSGVTVAEGAAAQLITATMLRATDAGSSNAKPDVHADGAPDAWDIKASGAVTLAVGGTFTQADIAAGQIAYGRDGSESTADGFAFTVKDGNGAVLTGQQFAVTVTPVNELPVVAVNTGLTVADGPGN